MKNTQQRLVSTIANEISKDWGSKVNYAAKPYLDIMKTFDTPDDTYGLDSGRGIIARFLCNASGWRGETARNVKKELNKMIK
jgi:hypothetical protein